MRPYQLAIFASGSGTNAEAIFTYFKDHPAIGAGLLLSNNPNAFALERAKKFDVPTKVFNREQWQNSDVILPWLQERNITHVVLAGFLWLVPAYLIKTFPNKIINIHPALLPAYGGKGMYGMKVHEAVKLGRENQTGITIHTINERYDEGEIIFQARCSVHESDTPDKIAEKVHALEHLHYPTVIGRWVQGK